LIVSRSVPFLKKKLSDVPAPSTKSSVLANGLRVVSRDTGSGVASVGIAFKAGSRFEATPGTSHVLEHLAFSGSQARSALKLQRDTEDLGAVTFARTGREVFSYGAEVLRDGADSAMAIVAEAATQPAFLPWTVAEGKQSLAALVDAQEADPVAALVEGLHAAAYGAASPMGHGLFATKAGLDDIDETTLSGFLGERFSAANAVVVAQNLGADEAQSMAERYFLSLPAGNAAASSAGAASAKPAVVGGEVLIKSTSGPAHVAIALEGSASRATLGVLQYLLGGTGPHGGAAGQVRLGPQKQSRLARSVHTEAHSFIRSLSAFSFAYSDSALVGVVGSCADHEAGRLVDALAGFLKDAASVQASAAELERAKKAFKLAFLSDAEARNGSAAALAESALFGGKSVEQVLAEVDAVDAAAVSAAAKSALASKPSLVAIGSLNALPRYDVFASLLK
jgi:predicted Zn-dependent peptidase